jgi:acyl transferase domain-containing protein
MEISREDVELILMWQEKYAAEALAESWLTDAERDLVDRLRAELNQESPNAQ